VTLGELPREAQAGPGAATSEGKPRWGMGLQDLTPPLRQRLELGPDQEGALVAQVQPGSPAQRGGLQPGDLLVSVGGTEVSSAQEAQEALSKAPEGEALRVRILRQGHGLFLVLPAGD